MKQRKKKLFELKLFHFIRRTNLSFFCVHTGAVLLFYKIEGLQGKIRCQDNTKLLHCFFFVLEKYIQRITISILYRSRVFAMTVKSSDIQTPAVSSIQTTN